VDAPTRQERRSVASCFFFLFLFTLTETCHTQLTLCGERARGTQPLPFLVTRVRFFPPPPQVRPPK